MATSYNKLWTKLKENGMRKKDLMSSANLSSYTIAKLTRGNNVTTDVLERICTALDCDFGDIMEISIDSKE